MGRKGGKDSEVELRRLQVARLLARGKSQQEIAAELGVHYSTVSRDVEKIRQRRIAQAVEISQAAAMDAIANYREMQRAAWEGYMLSLQDEVTQEVGSRGDSGVNVERRKGQSGNPSYLNTIKACEDAINEILGLMGKGQQNNIFIGGGAAADGESLITRIVVETREQLAEYMSLKQLQEQAGGVVEGKVLENGNGKAGHQPEDEEDAH
jgi:DNA-binding Lrp family transcriptional regulator